MPSLSREPCEEAHALARSKSKIKRKRHAWKVKKDHRTDRKKQAKAEGR